MKPILFNTEMVRAILDGRKTVTRRVVKLQPRMVYYDGELKDSGDDVRDGAPLLVLIAESQNGALEQIVPPYRPGDILYVREAFQQNYDGSYSYRAGHKFEKEGGWRPSIHMPREAARIFLRVTDVHVERLQDITEEQALKEGVYLSRENDGIAIFEFADLWNSTIKKAGRILYDWDANPYVWVIEFERCEKLEGE